MSTGGVRWAKHDQRLLVRALDRFEDTLWLVDPVTSKFQQVNTSDLAMSTDFDQAGNGDIFFAAETATSTGRVFRRPADPGQRLQEIYDPNPQLSDLEFQPQQRVSWKNKAGEDVDGILILPPNYKPSERYPAIVDVYPRAARDAFMLWTTPGMGQLVAAHGYVVLMAAIRAPHAPYAYSQDENYTERARGAKGIPIMVDDFTSGVDYLVTQGIADPSRIGIFGHSNGGYVANFLLTETNRAACAVVWSGSSDAILQQYLQGPPALWINEITNANIYDNLDEFVKMSPLLHMNKVNAPVLMIVGDGDTRTWLIEMLMEFNALQQLGKDVTLVRYDGEGHTFNKTEDIKDSLEKILTFFDKHLRRPADRP
jgi:dipeptidyl aminopeptidase/acylaminoacyl peptidase